MMEFEVSFAVTVPGFGGGVVDGDDVEIARSRCGVEPVGGEVVVAWRGTFVTAFVAGDFNEAMIAVVMAGPVRTCVCSRVFTTSKGHVITPAKPPAAPPVRISRVTPMSRELR